MKQRAIAIVVALVLVIGLAAGVSWRRRGGKHIPQPAQAGELVRPASGPPKYVRRIATPEERQHIADRIPAARAARETHGARPSLAGRATTAAPRPPSLPSTSSPPAEGELARASVPLRDALGEAIPLLADCFTPEQ